MLGLGLGLGLGLELGLGLRLGLGSGLIFNDLRSNDLKKRLEKTNYPVEKDLKIEF